VSSAHQSDGKALVLSATDIVELVGQTVKLVRRGRNFVGLCPFHQEKTPSFNVNAERQYFKCFGCGASGNAIDFVMRRDRVEFLDAMKELANRAGVELPRFASANQKVGDREQLLACCSTSAMLFEKWLSQEAIGKPARAYLTQRGINDQTIREFRIGYAPPGWDNLAKASELKKFAPTLLQRAGLLKQKDGATSFYDVFRNRLIFPIRDEQSRVIAFGGRVLPGSDDPAKYLNSPETPLFSKSRAVFGLDVARERIVATRRVVVVEGYTDVVMAHQFGVRNVVAVLGTALTEQHVSVLRRFADEIVLLFDADAAGGNATKRAVELFLTQPIEIRIATIPTGEDPDEYLLKHGSEAFEKRIDASTDALTFAWRQFADVIRSSGDNLTARQKSTQEYLDLLGGARSGGPVDPLRWSAVLARVSKLTEIPPDELRRRFRFSKPNRAKSDGAANAPQDPTQKLPKDTSHNLAPGSSDAGQSIATVQAERWILGTLLVEPGRWQQVQKQLAPGDFTESHAGLADIYWAHQRDEGEPDFKEFLGTLDDAAKQLATQLVEEIEQVQDLELTLNEALKFMSDQRERANEKLRLAQMRQDREDPSAELAFLKAMQDSAKRPDLRRV
jgi:DNA primase